MQQSGLKGALEIKEIPTGIYTLMNQPAKGHTARLVTLPQHSSYFLDTRKRLISKELDFLDFYRSSETEKMIIIAFLSAAVLLSEAVSRRLASSGWGLVTGVPWL